MLPLQSINYGIVAEWLGTALQKLVQRFESARCLQDLPFWKVFCFGVVLDSGSPECSGRSMPLKKTSIEGFYCNRKTKNIAGIKYTAMVLAPS